MTITKTSSTVQAIFALHVATAGLALLLLGAASLLLVRQLAGGPGRPRIFNRFKRSSTPGHSSLGTHLFLNFGLFNLLVAYATQAAIVALQTRINSPYYITSAYAYPSYVPSTGADPSTQYGKIISILSFLYQAAKILLNASIVGAIWIHANHLHNNGTGIREPGIVSWLWNLFWIIAILGTGFASWAVGLARRGSGNTALAYPSLISADYIVRSIYVAYVCVVIVASTSATIEAILCWLGIKANGVPGNRTKPALTRFVMLVTPIVWVRNAFKVAQIVLIYYNVNNWSRTTNQALAFLFIIFGELADLAILTLVLWGAWSFGRKGAPSTYVGKEGRDVHRESVSQYSHGVSEDRML